MDYLTLLEQGIESWNQWRAKHPNQACDLENQDLSHGYFFEGNFEGANLRDANLQRACLVGANFKGADLSGADLSGAYLGDANFYGANLAHANFTKTAIERADMRQANLLGTQFTDVDLRSVKLPDPKAEPYSSNIADWKLHPEPQQALTTDKNSAAINSTPAKPSFLGRITKPRKAIGRETTAEPIDWQQSVRLSSMPVRNQNKQAPSKRQKQRENHRKAKPAAANTSKKQNTQQQNTQWGRRESDQRLAALLGHRVRQQRNWIPAIAAAGIAIAVGIPFALPTIVNSQQQLATKSVTTLALTKSLTGNGQIRAIATHTPSNGTTQVIVGKSNGTIKIWDGQTGETINTLASSSESIQSIAMSESGQWLISSSNQGLNVWNPKTG